MRKLRNYAMLWLIGLLGTLTIWAASAYNSPEVLENWDLKICGTEYVSNTNGAEWCIIIQWKNVWATTTWAWSSALTTSYGNIYQWWNNYWFLAGLSEWALPRDYHQIDCNSFGPSNPFSSGTFIERSSSPYDYCLSGNDNMWWWWSDINGLVYPVENASERRWPCEEWYHVPSAWEWYALLDMRAGQKTNWFFMIYDWGTFLEDFQIPRVWGYNQGGAPDRFWLWSSSPGTSPIGDEARFMSIEIEWIVIESYYRAIALPVRCFKDPSLGFSSVVFWGDITELWSGNIENGTAIANSWDLLALLSWKIAELTGWSKQWYDFDGWYEDEATSAFDMTTEITSDLTLYAHRTPIVYSIKYNLDEWTIEVGSTNLENYTIESDDITLNNPSKEWYTFAWWTGTDLSEATLSVTIAKWSTWNREYYATWTANPKPVSHWWGWSTLRKDNCSNGDYSDSYYDWTCWKNPNNMSSWTEGEGSIDDNKDSSSQSSSEWQANNELQTAYEFAYENKITTMDSIEKADMEWWLTRIAMAKMLSQYAINVLWKKPANIIVPKFSDITEGLNTEYDYWVSRAYQLWIMWINMPDNKFRPFDLVTRAEFGTALSRLIFWIADWEEAYYTTHLAKLKAEWIITNDDPTLQELRWYVMLMLMRSKK